MSRYYALCEGRELPVCAHCKRFEGNNPDPNWYSEYIFPVTKGNDCAMWLPEVTPIETSAERE